MRLNWNIGLNKYLPARKTLNLQMRRIKCRRIYLRVAVGKLEKPKAKVAKAKPAKKTAPKAKPLKKVPAKKPAAKKTKKISAADTILGIIKRHKKGIEVDVLKKKAGLSNEIIYNTVSRLRKQGQIKSKRRGFYEKV
jgi:hypothetical protein